MAVLEVKKENTDKLSKNIMKPRRFDGDRREPSEFEEKVIEVRRVARTVKGGRRIRFRALVVIGNKKGKVGMGSAKANDVAEAVRKAVTKAKKALIVVPIIDGTIPYEITAKHGSAVVMLRPAAEGTSIVAGGAVRAVAELAGISDLLSKMLGSSNKINNIVATIKGFSSFKEDYINKVKKFTENKVAATPSVNIEEKIAEVKAEEKIVEKVEKKPATPKAAVKKEAKKKK